MAGLKADAPPGLIVPAGWFKARHVEQRRPRVRGLFERLLRYWRRKLLHGRDRPCTLSLLIFRMTNDIDYLSLSTTLITSLTLLKVMDAIWIGGAKIHLWVMILPRGSRERVSLLNCVLFPSFVKNFFFFFFCFFFRRISIQETGYDIEIFLF